MVWMQTQCSGKERETFFVCVCMEKQFGTVKGADGRCDVTRMSLYVGLERWTASLAIYLNTPFKDSSSSLLVGM